MGDDDDLYAADYLTCMYSNIVKGLADLEHERQLEHARDETRSDGKTNTILDMVHPQRKSLVDTPIAQTLTEWHLLDLKDMTFGFLDVANEPMIVEEEKRDWVLGWGFSFVYTRKAWESLSWPDEDFCEDVWWMNGLLDKQIPVLESKLPLPRFAQGLVAHCSHPLSCSGSEYAECCFKNETRTVLMRMGRMVPAPKEFQDLLRVVRSMVSSQDYQDNMFVNKQGLSGPLKVGLKDKEDYLSGHYGRPRHSLPNRMPSAPLAQR